VSPRIRKGAPAVFALLVSLGLGCRQDMHDQPKYRPLRGSDSFADARSARPLVAGTVARGALREDDAFFTGKSGGELVTEIPVEMTPALLARGQDRYQVFCAPCHGRTGEGNGMVVQRGYRQAANYHIDRLRMVPVGYFVDVMTNGFGVMPDYRAQIAPEDRWRIAAYVRALQLTRVATEKDVPAGELEKMNSGKAAGTTEPAAAHGGKQ